MMQNKNESKLIRTNSSHRKSDSHQHHEIIDNLKSNKENDHSEQQVAPLTSVLKNGKDHHDTLRTPSSVLAPCKGRLSISIQHNFAHITVHVIEAFGLRSSIVSSCNPYVQLTLYPENTEHQLCFESEVYQDSVNPYYDSKFSFELKQDDYGRRLLLSVWNKMKNDSSSEFLGCMSFGIKGFLSKKQISGCYYLLNESTGKRKHLKASPEPAPSTPLPPGVIPETNQALSNMQVFEFRILRGCRGFGFTLCGSCPVYVGEVDVDSPAKKAGLKPGDFIVKIDGVNVSRSTTESVVKIFRNCSNKCVHLIVCRPLDPVLSRPLPPVPASNSHHSNFSSSRTMPRSTSMSNPVHTSSQSEYMHEYMSCLDTEDKNDLKNNNSEYQKLKRDPVSIDDLSSSNRNVSPPSNNQSKPAQTVMSTSVSIPEPKSILKNSQSQPSNQAANQKLPPADSVVSPSISQTNNYFDIQSRLQYLGHLKKVNFARYSPRLEYWGALNLMEAGSSMLVDLFLFPDVLLIGQREPDGFITIIREPIFNSKVTYINIPTHVTNELILQYINESGKKQQVHFHGGTVHDWLVRIQSHMLYNCNWWINIIA